MEKIIICEVCGEKMEYRYAVKKEMGAHSHIKLLFWCPKCKKHIIKQRRQ